MWWPRLSSCCGARLLLGFCLARTRCWGLSGQGVLHLSWDCCRALPGITVIWAGLHQWCREECSPCQKRDQEGLLFREWSANLRMAAAGLWITQGREACQPVLRYSNQYCVCSLPGLRWEEGILENFNYFWYRACCQRDKCTACSCLRPTLILKSRRSGVLFISVYCSKVFFNWFHMTVFVDSAFNHLGTGFPVIEMVTPYDYSLAEQQTEL